jgi:hypothetical protein
VARAVLGVEQLEKRAIEKSLKPFQSFRRIEYGDDDRDDAAETGNGDGKEFKFVDQAGRSER